MLKVEIYKIREHTSFHKLGIPATRRIKPFSDGRYRKSGQARRRFSAECRPHTATLNAKSGCYAEAVGGKLVLFTKGKVLKRHAEFSGGQYIMEQKRGSVEDRHTLRRARNIRDDIGMQVVRARVVPDDLRWQLLCR